MFKVNGQTYATDKHDYLLHFEEWSPTLAEHIAQLEEVVMSNAHWEVIHFIREFYLEYETSPAMRILVKAIE